jgi:hypothetical protein
MEFHLSDAHRPLLEAIEQELAPSIATQMQDLYAELKQVAARVCGPCIGVGTPASCGVFVARVFWCVERAWRQRLCETQPTHRH